MMQTVPAAELCNRHDCVPFIPHMRELLFIAEATASGLEPTPITPDWVLSGDPVARARSVAMSSDKTLHVMAWHCTPGTFVWHFGPEEEIVYILEGEVFIGTHDGAERRLSGGDVAVFPPGTSCTWRVTQPVRKIAVLRKHLPFPLGIAVRAWHRILRLRRPASPLSTSVDQVSATLAAVAPETGRAG